MSRPTRAPSVLLAAFAASLGLLACGDGAGPVSGPGTLTATVESPVGSEGAAVLVVFGDGVEGVRQSGDGWLYSERSGDSVTVVVVADQPGVLTFGVDVADTTLAPLAEVLQVSGPDDELRANPSSYSVEFRR